jgi:NAD(P)-dependent dehydrogenase (short-subunit alcohol dehydrogenase family)
MLTMVALASMPVLWAYNASKAAGWSLTQTYRADLAKRGITVHGVFPGLVDTDMARPFEMPKTPAIDVAHATLDGVEAGEEDIFPDPMSRQLYSAWRQDHKSVERHFATM